MDCQLLGPCYQPHVMSSPYPGLFGFIPNITLAFSNFVDCDSCLIFEDLGFCSDRSVAASG